jgi:hypothetical protein
MFIFIIIINHFLNYNLKLFDKFISYFYGDWGLGIGDWGLGIGDWAQSPIPNPHKNK